MDNRLREAFNYCALMGAIPHKQHDVYMQAHTSTGICYVCMCTVCVVNVLHIALHCVHMHMYVCVPPLVLHGIWC